MFEVKLPKLKGDVEGSLVIAWFVSEGDVVEKGDRLVEVQTEKEVSELAAEEPGKVKEILVNRGDSAKVGEVLAMIDTEGSPKEKPVIQEVPAKESPDGDERAKTEAEETMERPDPEDVAYLGEEPPKIARIAPGIRKLARELEVELGQVKGTGRNGNLTAEDIRKAASGPAGASAEKTEREDAIPLSETPGMIARRMEESRQPSAQLTLTAWADVTKLVSKKEDLGYEVGWTALLAKAVAKGLRAHPSMNVQISGLEIQPTSDINLGFAIDTEQGQHLAVVQECDKLPVAALHAKMAELAEKARSGKLSNAENSGSTFSITSLGGYRIQFFTPIINPPETACLGIGKIEDYLVLKKGQVRVRKRLPLSLTVDHRTIKGATAAKFLDNLISMLEKPKLFMKEEK